MRARQAITSFILCIAIILTGLPIASIGVSAEGVVKPPKLTKEQDEYYDPVFTYDEDYYDAIVAASADIQDIGELPRLDDFLSMTGYQLDAILTLTEFRETYGISSSFIVPSSNVTIYIENEAELDLLSSLVNNTADSETAAEQAYYSTASYKLKDMLLYTGTAFQPIGNETYPFNGVFDGDRWEISDVKLISANAQTYPETGSFGLFGTIGTQGIVKNLGVVAETINLPYTIAASAGFIAGLNYGVIENCYVNSKMTSHITISNATAGGISGENYGVIRGCYAEAYISMTAEEGVYSEPQPITTVNHDGAVVENCYYLKWLSLVNSSANTVATEQNDRGTNSYIVGWRYLGDESQIYGTGLGLTDFITAEGMIGTQFSSGRLNVTQGNGGYYQYAASVKDLVDILGTGNSYDVFGASKLCNPGFIPTIYDREDWILFCERVNNVAPNESAAEQEFWSTATVYCATDSANVHKVYNTSCVELYADDIQLGTEEYPFRGALYCNDVVLYKKLEVAPNGDGVAKPLIGVNAGTLSLQYFTSGEDVSAYFDEALVVETNRGTISVIYLMTGGYSCTNSYDYSIKIKPDHPRYEHLYNANFTNALTDYDVWYIKNNYGIINTAFVGLEYTLFDADGNRLTDRLFGLVKNQMEGSSVVNVSDYTTSGSNNETSGRIGRYNYLYAWRSSYSSTLGINYNRVGTPPRKYDSRKFYNATIAVYPMGYAPRRDADGTVLIYEPRDLIWLFKYGNNDNAKLMNTVDMTNNKFIGGTPYTGSFSIDGTLTDHTDICDRIDIGVTKCYGIINLQIKNRTLLQKDRGEWHNIYFIGGSFVYDRDYHVNLYKAAIMGKLFDRCHSSMDIDVAFNSSNLYSSYNDAYCAMVDLAQYSSYSGLFVNRSWGYRKHFSVFGETNNDCVFYTKLAIGSNTGSDGYGYDYYMGYNVNHCINRASIYHADGYYTGFTQYLKAGEYINDSLMDATYEIVDVCSSYFFGQYLTNCCFSGSYITTHKVNGKVGGLCGQGVNLVFTPSSHIDGLITNICGSNDSHHILFQGTADMWGCNTSQTLLRGNNDLIITGTVNIHSTDLDETQGYTYARLNSLGINKKSNMSAYYSTDCSITLIQLEGRDGFFAGTLNFVDFDTGVAHPELKVMMFSGKGCNMNNYADINFHGLSYIYYFAVFRGDSNTDLVRNYGNITADDTFVFHTFYIVSGGGNAAWKNGGTNYRNYGDVSVNSACLFYLMEVSNRSANHYAINYGNVTLSTAYLDIIPEYFYIIYSGYNEWNQENNLDVTCKNYGDIYIDLKNSTNICRAVGIAYGGSNYGDITIKNIQNFEKTFISTYSNYGNVEMEHCCGSLSFYEVYYSSVPKGQDSLQAYGDVTIKDCTCKSTAVFTNVYMQNRTSASDTVAVDIAGTKLVQNCTSTGNNYSHRICAMLTSGVNAFLEVTNNSTLTVDTFTGTTNVLYVTGGICTVPANFNGYIHNNADILCRNINVKNFYVSGIANENNNTQHAEWVNTGSLTVKGLKSSGESHVCGCVSNSNISSNNMYNFGAIDVDTDTETSDGTLIVSGISCGGTVNTADTIHPLIVANFGDITVKSSKRTWVQGIACLSGAKGAVRNAINTGDIVVTMLSNRECQVEGIARNANDIQSVENFGNIIVNDATNGVVTAIATTNGGKLYSAVNYGNITVNDGFSGEITVVKTTSANDIAEYVLNYGTFNRANTTTLGEYRYIIDLGGNMDCIPTGCTFTTDNVTDTTLTYGRDYNDLEYAVKELTNLPYRELRVSRHIAYADIVKPEFGLRYNNILSPEYITTTTKLWYNTDNHLEYADRSRLVGKLASTVDSYNGTGGYALCATDYDGTHLLGVDLDLMFYKNAVANEDNAYAWWNNCIVDNMTFKQFLNTYLKQRTVGTDCDIIELNIASVDEQETKGGEFSTVKNKSTLTTFQAPVDVDNDGVYSDNLTVTVIDLYVAVNDYKNITNTDIDWTVTQDITTNAKMRLLTNPIVCSDADDLMNKIKLLAEETTLPDTTTADTVTLKLGAVGGTVYYVLGIIKAEDGVHKNIVTVKLHSITTDPLGWATRFSYPKDYNRSTLTVSELPLSENFFADTFYYDAINRFSVPNGDLYTVTQGTPELEDYVDSKYPIYTMSDNMMHTGDGYWYSYWGNYITSMENMILQFRTVNLDKYKIVIESDNVNTFTYEGKCPAEGISSKDGSQTIKYNTVSFKDVEFKDSDGNTMSFRYADRTRNPFYYSGDKEITVWGITNANDEIPILQLRVTKNMSYENYLKWDAIPRYWFNAHNSSSSGSRNKGLSLLILLSNTFNDNTWISTFATRSNVQQEYGQFVQHGESYYPTFVKDYVDITAENGDITTYSYEYIFPDFDIVPCSFNYTPSQLLWLNRIFVFQEDSNYFDIQINPNNAYLSGLTEYGTINGVSGQTVSWDIEKVEILVDGQHYDWMTVNERKDDAHYNGLGLRLYNGHLYCSPSDKSQLPDGIITCRLYCSYQLPASEKMVIRLDDISFRRELSKAHQLISARINNAMSGQFVSDVDGEETENVEAGENGVITYHKDYTEIEHLYIYETVEVIRTSSTATYVISPNCQLQFYNGSSWNTVYTSGSSDTKYTVTYNYDMNTSGGTLTYKYRILAQAYDENDAEKATYVSYFDHIISAAKRNKDLTIYFDMNDAVTSTLYNEIINNNGNLSVQVKNMNVGELKWQQTKFYVGNESLESNFYKLSQGDFAILTNLPEGYTYRIQIIGTSSEGYLNWSSNTKGYRLKLPFPHQQNVTLAITLQRQTISNWGIQDYNSTYKHERSTVI